MAQFPFASAAGPTGRRTAACLITGASRGFGRALALALVARARRSASGAPAALHLLLCASSLGPALSETARLVHAAAAAPPAAPPAVPPAAPLAVTTSLLRYASTVDTSPAAAARRAADHAALTVALAAPPWAAASAHALFNNAGLLGATAPVAALSYDDYLPALAVAVAGAGAAAQAFLAATAPPAAGPRWLVHTSSLAARRPLPRWAVYSASKAAGDALHAAIAAEAAEEEAACGARRTRVLNYAPGPMLTDMAREAMAAGELRDVERWVGVDESAGRLMALLAADSFDDSGRSPAPHIDFFDRDPSEG